MPPQKGETNQTLLRETSTTSPGIYNKELIITMTIVETSSNPLFKPIHDYLVWTATNIDWPEQGRAIVWISPRGEQIEGCVSYILKRRCIEPPAVVPQWLPLLDSRFHEADKPINYLPALWRYK